ncbi:MAG: hypothetical protein CSA35_00785 [Dethiosulfovibrio peptidovorans]|nr:MAG: hypothetical protein CSA35_00785 [Dethiosulfovibrio peptidovorans]
MVTIYGGTAPAPELPDRTVDGKLYRYCWGGRVSVLLFFNGARDDDLSLVDGLMRLRAEDQDAIDLVGVHCPRFPAEREPRRLLAALDRAGIDFPIYADSNKFLRKAFLIKHWPATVVIDPMGALAWAREGLVPLELLRPVLQVMARTARSIGDLRQGAQPSWRWSDWPFLPLRIAVQKDLLAILDGRENRLLLARFRADGLSASILLSVPLGDQSERPAPATGLCLHGERIYISHRRSRKIRCFNFRGQECAVYQQEDRLFPKLIGGRSFGAPKDAARLDGVLYVASSDSRQIWIQSISGGGAWPFTGSGQEGMDDGSPDRASLGQVESIVSDGHVLFFSDSLSSSIRWVNPANGLVQTLIGEGPSLYGNRDGSASQALLQRPEGLCAHEGLLYIADSYNDRIRTLNLTDMTVSTIYGARRWQRLFSPSDVAVRGERVYVADLGHGHIVSFDGRRGEPETLELVGLS